VLLSCEIVAGKIPAPIALDSDRIIAFRLVFSTGREGGRTASRVHAHVPGGRPMTWPPG
jgi:diadenosine tetraphosphate (Ap4A) HIT family hydrolase